ncbi:MAG: S1/P1 nuclease [bacterium]
MKGQQKTVRFQSSFSFAGCFAMLAGFTALSLICPTQGYSWGDQAHRYINREAVSTLPPEMKPFFEANKQILEDNASAPDRRRRVERETEAPRHFLDIESYGKFPFVELPDSLAELEKRFGNEYVKKNGCVPYAIDECTSRMVQAMKENNWEATLRIAADIGHYVGDAHQPLHCTVNYNGAETGQTGVHSQFESRLIAAHFNELVSDAGPAHEISNVLDFAKKVCIDSNVYVDNVLLGDLRAQEAASGARDNDKYLEVYWQYSGEIAKKRIAQASTALGSVWLTAWKRAGSPELPKESLNLKPDYMDTEGRRRPQQPTPSEQ